MNPLPSSRARFGSEVYAPVFDPRDRRDLRIMRARSTRALKNMDVVTRVSVDLSVTLKALGIEGDAAIGLIQTIFVDLATSTSGLLSTEAGIRNKIHSAFPNLRGDLPKALSGRARLVVEQLVPFISTDKRIADLGCGDGRVTQLVESVFEPTHIVGYDVVSYPADGVTVPIHKFDGRTVPLAADDVHSFDYVLLTNVLHHAEHNGWLITEARRLLKRGGRAIVHETIPIPDFENDPVEVERLFLLDYLYNRIFHEADIPVPGAYEKLLDWPERFKFGGLFRPQYGMTELGIDQPLIQDYHVVYQFTAS